MKNNYLRLSLLCLLSQFIVNNVFSQDNPFGIRYQDSIQIALQKFNMQFVAYPQDNEIAPCPKIGQPKLQLPLPQVPLPTEGDPINVIGDTTRAFMKTDSVDRNVFWIHGLNGNTNSLAIAAKASEAGMIPPHPSFPARKIRSYRGLPSNTVQLYSEENGIAATSSDLDYYARTDVPLASLTERDFIISHSQGGIVGREWLRNMDKNPQIYKTYAYGLVTFGTPHGGAEILNNCRPNLGRDKVPKFMKDACEALGSATLIPTINDNFATSLLPSAQMKKIIAGSCSFLSKSIIPIVIDNYYKPTTKDFYVSAPFLEGETINGQYVEGLNQYTSKVPVVQFYGIEEQPILWRFMGSTMDVENVQKDSSNNKLYFGFSNDDLLPKKVNDLIIEYSAKFELEKSKEKSLKKASAAATATATTILILPGANGLAFAFYASAMILMKKSRDAKQNKEAYDRGKVWLTNANDYYLTDLIGARVSKTNLKCQTVGLVYCRSAQYNPAGSGVPATEVKMNYATYPSNNICSDFPNKSLTYTGYFYESPWNKSTRGDCQGMVQQVIQSWTTVYSYKENDGVVLAESAQYPIKVDPLQSKFYVKMPKTNHDQMKNCTATKTGLTNLYEGELGKFFRTEIR